MKLHFSTTLPSFGRFVAPVVLLAALPMIGQQADFVNAPHKTLNNGPLKVNVYLPAQKDSFYQGVRFDGAGMLSLEFAGHQFYYPWFNKFVADTRDFAYGEGGGVEVGTASAALGPAEEFDEEGPASFAEAAPGGTFVKFGVGVLRRTDDQKYSIFGDYPLVDGGKRSTKATKTSVAFTQDLDDAKDGYGYHYVKTVRLEQGKPTMYIEHTIRNTGKKTIDTTLYTHNFLVLDHQPPGPDFKIELPFQPVPKRKPRTNTVVVEGNKLVYTKVLEGKDQGGMEFTGFGSTAKDYSVRIENTKLGVGLHITGDQPLAAAELWSVKTTLALEPFVHIVVAPGESKTWTLRYDYYRLKQ